MTTLYTNHIRAWIDLGSDQNVLGNGNIAGSSGSVGGTGPIGEIDGFAVGITGSGVHAVTGGVGAVAGKSATVPVSSFVATFDADAPNVLSASLPPGSVGGQGQALTSINFPRGTSVELWIQYRTDFDRLTSGVKGGYTPPTNETFRLFRGYVDDLGPGNVADGSFTIDLRAIGNLNLLNIGTLQSGRYLASSLIEFTNGALPLGSPFYGGELVDEQSNFGRDFMKAMIRIAQATGPQNSGSLTETVLSRYFGADSGNTAAAAYMGGLLTNVAYRKGVSSGVRAYIASWLGSLMRMDYRNASFYRRIQDVGRILGFRLHETAEYTTLIPYTPFITAKSCRVITPDTYQRVSRVVASADQFQGLAIAPSRGSDTPINVFVGHHARETAGPGKIEVTDAPMWLRSGAAPDLATNEAQGDIPGSALSSDVILDLGDQVARHMLLERNYEPRSYVVTCPFLRTDLAPLSGVRVDFPKTLGLDLTSVYGSVQKVTISCDAQAGSATTTLQVGYARTAQQQSAEVDSGLYPHPLWSTAFTGRRLDGST